MPGCVPTSWWPRPSGKPRPAANPVASPGASAHPCAPAAFAAPAAVSVRSRSREKLLRTADGSQADVAVGSPHAEAGRAFTNPPGKIILPHFVGKDLCRQLNPAVARPEVHFHVGFDQGQRHTAVGGSHLIGRAPLQPGGKQDRKSVV